MIATHLSLTDFRNYPRLETELFRGANVFVGQNGQGKTNLVEALAYLSDLSSHRVSSHHPLIRSGQSSAIIRANLQHGERQILAELQLNATTPNRAQVNRTAVKTAEITRYFSSVMFAPEDLALVRGEPSGRRRFVDELLCQLAPRFRGVIADYERVVRQRSALLKTNRAKGASQRDTSSLDVWDERLIALGVEIMQARSRLVTNLRPLVNKAYGEIAGPAQHAWMIEQKSVLELSLPEEETAGEPRTDAQLAVCFHSALSRVRLKEFERGVSLVGPHRDDVVFTVNDLPARTHSSHGESWSLALALKLSAARLLRSESTTGDPVLILDDVFAELDAARRARLSEAISDYEQVLITAAVFDDVPPSLTGHVVHIRSGAIVDGLELQ